jgi:hypothetical protein
LLELRHAAELFEFLVFKEVPAVVEAGVQGFA